MKKQISKRIEYLDIARGFAIFFMFIQHSVILHEKASGEGSDLIGNVFLALGKAPAAPIFMFVMGIFLMRTRASLKDNILRGLKLFLYGYILNFLRIVLPLLALGVDTSEIASGASMVELFLTVDILQLAGLSLIAGALLKRFLPKNFYPILIFLIMLISPELWGSFNNHLLLTPISGTGQRVIFPFLPWFIFPLYGMFLSSHLTDAANIITKLKNMFISSSIILVISTFLLRFSYIGEYSRGGFFMNLSLLSFVGVWIPLCYCIFHLIKDSAISNLLTNWSKNLTSLYVIQWIIFGWSILLIGSNNFTGIGALLIGIFVIILSNSLISIKSVRKFFKALF